jgi:23S rRNA (cytidine1920-2'-O)/16S rRNA (cytidine1409-2'-O)-methyltransferase
VGKNGVVRDPQDQAMAVLQVLQAAQAVGWHYHGVTWSPLLGPAGNIEYLLWLKEGERSVELPEPDERLEPNTAIAREQSSAVPSPDLNALKQVTLAAQQTLNA